MAERIAGLEQPSLVIMNMHGRADHPEAHFLKMRYGRTAMATDKLFRSIAARDPAPHDYLLIACEAGSAHAGFLAHASRGSALVTLSGDQRETDLEDTDRMLTGASRNGLTANHISADRLLSSFLMDDKTLLHEPEISIAGTGTWNAMEMVSRRRRSGFTKQETERVDTHLRAGLDPAGGQKLDAALRAIRTGGRLKDHLLAAQAVVLAADEGIRPPPPSTVGAVQRLAAVSRQAQPRIRPHR